MTAHHPLSPSGAHRWMRCPGSRRLLADTPRRESKYADEGTWAHNIAAICLDAGCSAKSFVGQQLAGKEVTEEVAGHVDLYLDTVAAYMTPTAKLYVEVRLPIPVPSSYGDLFGTADAVVVDGETYTVIDLKYGKGVKVVAEDNEQALLYALGAVSSLRSSESIAREVRMVIVQPRVEQPVSEAAMLVEDLMTFHERANQAAARTELPDAPLIAGEKQCRFCDAKPKCPAQAELVASTLLCSFDDLTNPTVALAKPDIKALADEQIMGVFAHIKLIEEYCASVFEYARQRMMEGHSIPGMKLVEGRAGNRKWTDEMEVARVLKGMRLRDEEMYDYKVKTPPNIQKQVSERQWKKLEAFIERAAGKLTPVLESDKRPAVQPGDMFDNLD